MKTINVCITGGTAAADAYVIAPARGTVVSAKATFSKTVAANDTVTFSRGGDTVNLITTGATTAGAVYTGVRDTTNKELIFDPDSSTEANKMIKVAVSALESLLTEVNVEIKFDEFALQVQ